MSVAGIFSTLSQLQLGHPPVAKQSLQQLGQALQSGNLTAAQSDFAALKQAFAQTAAAATTSASTTASPIMQAFNQLASDLQSGNLSASQKDFSNLQQDIQSASGTGSASSLHHRHHANVGGGGSGSGGSSASASQNSLFQYLNQLDRSSAQQAYASLQGGGQVATESPVSMLA